MMKKREKVFMEVVDIITSCVFLVSELDVLEKSREWISRWNLLYSLFLSMFGLVWFGFWFSYKCYYYYLHSYIQCVHVVFYMNPCGVLLVFLFSIVVKCNWLLNAKLIKFPWSISHKMSKMRFVLFLCMCRLS